MFEALIFWTLLAVVVGVVAEKRGRSGVGWFLISLFISPVLSLLILIAMQPAGGAAASEVIDPKTLTRCTQCRELIRKDALKCKHCGSDHTPEPIPKEFAPRVSQSAAMLIIAAGVILLVTQCGVG